MQKFKNCVAVITGAGSGIGRQLAIQLADAGAHLALSDIDHASLQHTHDLIQNNEINIQLATLDVADREAVFAYAERVANEFGHVNLLFNNAGVALASGSLLNTSIEDFKWLMDINFYGVLYGCKAFLPILQNAEWGNIINVSSLFGLLAVENQSAYNSSKFAVRGLTEALRIELDAMDSHVSCTSVHPGGIKTNIAKLARVGENATQELITERNKAVKDFDKIAQTTAESAAQQILNAVLKNKKRVLIGPDAKVLDKIQRLFPTRYSSIFNWMINKLS
ncbi:MAG: SDR family NAD(P)-dependent oxidoreductase [Gammaproteobacteria bacterium]|nr:SDR family NAD(P)-dependent oxidoreductase [Gammaproteobacteria bacterium]NNC96834.1 SDR family NAD(P)-dependent oxidoreductase [Gammaproteobacteria bacterium]NNM14089.1 SDR family NAD(P)-dependent oxidoreductase [Gammaproteobacteria bacterium]